MSRHEKKVSGESMRAAFSSWKAGESARSIARRFGISHVAMLKRLRALDPRAEAVDGFCLTEVEVIAAVAKAGVKDGLALLAAVFDRPLLDVVNVAARFSRR